MQNTLFVINGSHPCVTVEQALALKGVPVRKIEIMPGMQPMLRLMFGGLTVPAIRFEDGRRVQGSRAILRVLEDRIPSPRLYGSDAIEEAATRVYRDAIRELFLSYGTDRHRRLAERV